MRVRVPDALIIEGGSMNISLHHLTVSDVSTTELVDIASELGCSHVCFMLKTPGDDPLHLPRVQNVQEARALRQRLFDEGMGTYNTDTFIAHPDNDPAFFGQTLAIAAALGAKTLNCLNLHPDSAKAIEQFSRVNKMASDLGVQLVLEWFRFSQVKTLESAVEFVQAVDMPRMGLNVDILHLMRNGGRPEDLAKVDPQLMQYAQISDGPLNQPENKQFGEAVGDRNFPGEEEFPLVSFIQHLPEKAVISIEAPVNRLRERLGPRERAKRAVEGTRSILVAAGRHPTMPGLGV
jgi:sugar phosphate isomerase/epimerase